MVAQYLSKFLNLNQTFNERQTLFHQTAANQLTLSETKMLETVAQYLSSNCFSWRADKMRKQLPKGPAENTFYHKYYVVRKLGSGGYGTVFLVGRRSDDKKFAAKIVPQARCRRTTWCSARQVNLLFFVF